MSRFANFAQWAEKQDPNTINWDMAKNDYPNYDVYAFAGDLGFIPETQLPLSSESVQELYSKQTLPTVRMTSAESVSTTVAQPEVVGMNRRPLYNPEWDVTVTPEQDYWKQVWESAKFEAKEIPKMIKDMPLVALKSIVDPAGTLERYATADEKTKGTAIQKAMGKALADKPGMYDVGKGWLEHIGRLVVDPPKEFQEVPLMTVGDALIFMSAGRRKGHIGSYKEYLPKKKSVDVSDIKVEIPKIKPRLKVKPEWKQAKMERKPDLVDELARVTKPKLAEKPKPPVAETPKAGEIIAQKSYKDIDPETGKDAIYKIEYSIEPNVTFKGKPINYDLKRKFYKDNKLKNETLLKERSDIPDIEKYLSKTTETDFIKSEKFGIGEKAFEHGEKARLLIEDKAQTKSELANIKNQAYGELYQELKKHRLYSKYKEGKLSKFKFREIAKPIEDKYKQKGKELKSKLASESGAVKPEQLVGKFTKENVAHNITEQQKGFVRISGKKELPSLNIPKNPRIEEMYKRGTITNFIKNKMLSKAQGVKKWTGQLLDEFSLYRGVKKKHPEFYTSLRELPGLRSVAGSKADDYISSVVGKLKNRKEYETFQRYVQFKDFEERIRQGLELPRQLSLSEVGRELMRLETKLTPVIKEATQRHWDLQRAIGKDLIRRKRLFPGLSEKEAISNLRKYYYRHDVLDHPLKGKSITSGIGTKLKKRFRPYTLQAKGSALDIELDYTKTFDKHYRQYLMDNAIDDFINMTVGKHADASKVENVVVGKKTYTRPIEGWVEWRDSDRLRVIAGEDIGGKFADMMMDDLLQKISESPKGMSVEEALKVGDVKKFIIKSKPVIIPERIAQVLENIKPVDTRPAWLKAVNTATMWWKLAIVNPWLNPSFFWLQVLGDPAYLLASKARAFGKIPKTAFEIGKERIGKPLGVSRGSEYYQEAVKRGGIKTGFFAAGEMPKVSSSLRYWRFMTPPEKIWNTIKTIPNTLLELNVERENLFRMARFVYEVDKGTDPSNAAVFARTTGVDYGNFTPFENTYLRQGLLPFYAFMKGNTVWWTKQLATRPHSLLLKFGLPYYLTSLYNEEKYPEIEKKLHENESTKWIANRFHVIMGKDKEGRPIIFSPNTPLDDYLEWFDIGISDIGKHVTNLVGWEKANPDELWNPTLKSFIYKGFNYVTPIIKEPIQQIQNWDYFKKRTIVPKYLQAQPAGKRRSVEDKVPFTDIEVSRRQRHFLEAFAAPFRAAQKLERNKGYGLTSAMLGLPVYAFQMTETIKFPKVEKDQAWWNYLDARENNDIEAMQKALRDVKFYSRTVNVFRRDFKSYMMKRKRGERLRMLPPELRVKEYSK